MGRETWESIKQSKSFFVATYRRAMIMVIFSMLLNLLFIFGIYYGYFNRPERHYYSTNGVTPPMELAPLTTPNYTGAALLPPDTVSVRAPKLIPQ